ncbi:MAG: helix-turn-helix transcriptional regulator [Lachnospiraceae bacterium]|nr:helix-turn-helix transcriptional regulator [Lachnospiraceae bacterium]
MVNQPVLEDALQGFGNIRFQMVHREGFFDVERTAYEGAHIHNCYEIYINVSGELSFLQGHTIYDIRPGDVIFSRPGEVHYCIYHRSTQHHHYCMWFDGEGPLKEYIEGKRLPAHIRPEDLSQMWSLLAKMEKCTEQCLRMAYFIEFLAAISGEYSESSIGLTPADGKLGEMLAYIDGCFLEEVRISEIATRFYISESSVNRLFRRYVGMSLYRFVEAKRLAHAERLLRSGYSVTEACFQSGFTDCSRFIQKFKQKFGTTPHKYKKSCLENKINVV